MAIGMAIRATLLGMVVAGGVAGVAGYYLIRRPVPRCKGRTKLAGLRSGAEVIRDRWGVPHVYAGNLHDLFFAVGYAQAQDRLWQMEFNRRAASGTLAEVLGEGALEIDRLLRRAGLRRVSEVDWQNAEATERAVLEAFAAGVNAFMESQRLPMEFSILRYRPQPWHPVDSLAFGRVIAWALSGNWEDEVLTSWTVERFGADVATQLEPNYPPGTPLVVPPGTEAKGAGPSMEEDYGVAAELLGALAGSAQSNNWVVSGDKSVTGKPLLANDPHLILQMPSIFWEVHMDSPELKVSGAALPGVPGIIIGHNDRIAWGVTASRVDGDDLFVEQVNPDNPSQARFQDAWEDGQMIREEINVRGRPEPLVEDVLVTRHGPIISPAIKGETRALALRSVVLEPAHQIRSVLLLMGARDWDEFRQAIKLWPSPSQNMAYADVDGNIGYQLAGLVPVRAKGYGVVPVPGWTGDYEWTGWVPFEELPFAFNPPTGRVATANNKIVDDDYPHFLAAHWIDSPRQERIVEMLSQKEKFSIDDFQRMQADQVSLPARELVPRMRELRPRDEWSRRALTFIRAWDYQVAADSVAACVFEAFYTHLVRIALEEKIGSWSDFYMGRGIHPVRPDGGFFVYFSYGWLMSKIKDRKKWFADKGWPEAMEESLARAVAELRELMGDDVSRWQWGRIHRVSFRHALGVNRALAPLFNRGPVPVGGDPNTVWQASYAPYEGYELVGGTACYRQIIDLADFDNSVSVIPSGESGHPGSRHYGDMIRLWAHGEYHPMLWSRASVQREAKGRLLLEPRDGDGAGVSGGD